MFLGSGNVAEIVLHRPQTATLETQDKRIDVSIGTMLNCIGYPFYFRVTHIDLGIMSIGIRACGTGGKDAKLLIS